MDGLRTWHPGAVSFCIVAPALQPGRAYEVYLCYARSHGIAAHGTAMAQVVNEADRAGETDQVDSIQDIERLLLQASTAIQRLISERDGLRRRVQTLENEVTSLGQRMKLVQDGYRRLATEFVSQLRLLDNGVGELFGETIQPETFSETKAAASDIRDDHNY